jgi:hypothetical protein
VQLAAHEVILLVSVPKSEPDPRLAAVQKFPPCHRTDAAPGVEAWKRSGRHSKHDTARIHSNFPMVSKDYLVRTRATNSGLVPQNVQPRGMTHHGQLRHGLFKQRHSLLKQLQRQHLERHAGDVAHELGVRTAFAKVWLQAGGQHSGFHEPGHKSSC